MITYSVDPITKLYLMIAQKGITMEEARQLGGVALNFHTGQTVR